MGRMKDIYIDICNANNGEIPYDLTIEDVVRMKELEIYEWKEYCSELQKNRINSLTPEERQKIYDNEDWVKVRKDHPKNQNKE